LIKGAGTSFQKTFSRKRLEEGEKPFSGKDLFPLLKLHPLL